jgi:hypothetical protein
MKITLTLVTLTTLQWRVQMTTLHVKKVSPFPFPSTTFYVQIFSPDSEIKKWNLSSERDQVPQPHKATSRLYLLYECVSKSFRTESIKKWTTTTTINTSWEATQRVMVVKLTRLTHKIAIQLHLVAESFTICSSRSRRPVRKPLDSPSYISVSSGTYINSRTEVFLRCWTWNEIVRPGTLHTECTSNCKAEVWILVFSYFCCYSRQLMAQAGANFS